MLALALVAAAVYVWRVRRQPRLDALGRVGLALGLMLLLWGSYEQSAVAVAELGAIVAFVFTFAPMRVTSAARSSAHYGSIPPFIAG